MSTKAPILESENLFIGEDRTLRFTVVDSAGSVVDISAYALEWVMRARAGSATESIAAKAVGTGITITDGPNGLCEVAVADNDTVSLEPGRYFHTLRRTDAGLETVLSFGDVTLRQAATR